MLLIVDRAPRSVRSRFIYPLDLLRNWTTTLRRNVGGMRTIQCHIIYIYIYIYVYRIEYNRNRQTSHFLDAILFDSYTYTPFLASFFLLSFNRSFIQNAKSMNVIFGGSSDRPTHSSPFSRAMESPMRFSVFFFPSFFRYRKRRTVSSKGRCRIRRDLKSIEVT